MTARVGWDIGGAHLKAARFSDGVLSTVVQLPCPLWRGEGELDRAWRRAEAMLHADRGTEHAVTMTGELADCFASRKAGVGSIVSTVARCLQKPFKVYAAATGFIDAGNTAGCADQIASANWHATAACLGTLLGSGVLMDIGSTTTDIVPFVAAGAASRGGNDCQRLRSGELVYTGVVRTPVMALADKVWLEGRRWPVVAELFATAADVYRILGMLAEDADQHPACDAGAKTPAASERRLARMFGCDVDAADDWSAYARALADCQTRSIEAAYRRVCGQAAVAASAPIVGAGAGRFLARDVARRAGRSYIDFSELFDTAAGDATRLTGDCASAVSVAFLMASQSWASKS